MLKWLKRLLKALWKIIKKIWPVLLALAVVVFLCNPALFAAVISWCGTAFSTIWAGLSATWSWWTGLFEGLSFWEGAALAVGTAFLLDPEWAAKTISDIGSSVGGAVGSVAAGTVGGVASGLSDSGVLWWIVGGVCLYAYLSSDSSDDSSDSYGEAQVMGSYSRDDNLESNFYPSGGVFIEN